MKKRDACALALVLAMAFIATIVIVRARNNRPHDLRITIPAGNQAEYVFAAEEFSPRGNTITIESGEGLGDTMVTLQPVEAREENAYEPTYLTPGLPVEMDVDKGAWFKVGVNMHNATEQDITAYVTVSGIEFRPEDEPEG